jgi:DNA-nicking Smr family endonuclease
MSKRPRDGRTGPPDPPPDPPPASARRSKGPPVPDDLDLWRHTARSVTPLRKAKPRVPEVGPPQDLQPKPRPAPSKPAPAPPPLHIVRNKTPPQPPKRAGAPSPPPLVPIERRKARRIARGIVEIDDRIDLHGLRQADAERRLRAFLLGARAHGLRTVLVITGKGGERGTSMRDDGTERSERGVLRRSVPLWLEQPDLRDCVAGIAPAHIRHGGSGAVYIHIRKIRVR